VDDIETIINKYEKAPLIELEDFKCPGGGNAFFINGFDNKRLRVALWNINSDEGTIILQSGRTEFIEKYYEVIEGFISRGYCVAAMDWRGQGLSDRTCKNIRLGHIDSFEEYDKDLIKTLEVYNKICPKPWIGFGHSMGGCLMASNFVENQEIYKALILCAPMLSIQSRSSLRILVSVLGSVSSIGFKDFAINKPNWDHEQGWLEEEFNDNFLTSDQYRFNRVYRLISKEHALGVKGLSLGWIYEAIKRTNLFKDKKWGTLVEKPSLLLNATRDRLVSPSGNVQILSKFRNSHVENIDSRHEIFMESDPIRNKAWEKVDEFLGGL
tara:strand:- start:336 stop:1310 length:975 start_codon:yes stop_codon:yes gene_type:complete